MRHLSVARTRYLISRAYANESHDRVQHCRYHLECHGSDPRKALLRVRRGVQELRLFLGSLRQPVMLSHQSFNCPMWIKPVALILQTNVVSSLTVPFLPPARYRRSCRVATAHRSSRWPAVRKTAAANCQIRTYRDRIIVVLLHVCHNWYRSLIPLLGGPHRTLNNRTLFNRMPTSVRRVRLRPRVDLLPLASPTVHCRVNHCLRVVPRRGLECLEIVLTVLFNI